ncbi:MAG: FHA domain-containing protein, partial [Planctomycetes bacterium]|nr:FHA domain-containing protein [Planctomycetota bacterium]
MAHDEQAAPRREAPAGGRRLRRDAGSGHGIHGEGIVAVPRSGGPPPTGFTRGPPPPFATGRRLGYKSRAQSDSTRPRSAPVPEPHLSPSAAASLVLQIAGHPGPAFPLDQAADNVLGRASGTLVALADRLASRHHAVVRRDAAGSWTLVDLGSRNGTWLDGVRVTRGTLVEGSVVRVGTTEFVFRATAPRHEPAVAAGGRRVVRGGTPAELEGVALERANRDNESRWPMLLYQSGLRLLAASGPRDVVFTTLELAAEFTAATSFAWLDVDAEGHPTTVCAVPPASDLPALVTATAWQEAIAGRAAWLAADESAGDDIACVPLAEGGRIRAALAAGGAIRKIDFDLLVSLASLAAAALAGCEARPCAGAEAAAPTDPLDESQIQARFEGTLALTGTDVSRLQGGGPADS